MVGYNSLNSEVPKMRTWRGTFMNNPLKTKNLKMQMSVNVAVKVCLFESLVWDRFQPPKTDRQMENVITY